MITRKDKKENLRTKIILASQAYRDKLAGRIFLYVIGEEYFEVVFQTDCFMHLTGVNSILNAQDFYEKSKDSTLNSNQIYFDARHPYAIAKRKISYLPMLAQLTSSLVCIVRDMQTLTLTYKIGITNIDFTLGLTENTDFYGNKINDWFLPRTLRIRDKAIENCVDAEFVDFIFSRNASLSKYDTVNFISERKSIPNSIKPMLSMHLIDTIFLI